MGLDVQRRFVLVAAALSALVGSTLFFPCLRGAEPCSPAGLLLTPDQRGQRLFAAGAFESAAETFVEPGWRATALYRAGEFKDAAAVWAGLPGADAAYDRGNALVLVGRYDDAIGSYDRALALRPRWESARTNREIAVLRAARTEPQGGEMTGGVLEADEIVFSKNPIDDRAGTVEVPDGATDEGTRAVWLRQVETRPGDFLRSRFAYDLARREESAR